MTNFSFACGFYCLLILSVIMVMPSGKFSERRNENVSDSPTLLVDCNLLMHRLPEDWLSKGSKPLAMFFHFPKIFMKSMQTAYSFWYKYSLNQEQSVSYTYVTI